MAEQRYIDIDPLSASSLRVQTMVNGIQLAIATGFIVASNARNYLITNWHVVTGRDPNTQKPLSDTAGIPDSIQINHHSIKGLGCWIETLEKLYCNEQPCWLEHPYGPRVDVVALPLSKNENCVKVYPLNLSLADVDVIPVPAMSVSIIGYPYGLSTGGGWPIWKTGHIASDPDLDYDNLPAFLIDATTRSGMSGAPVVLRLSSGYRTKGGANVLVGNPTTRFLGVYSGRIHGEAEIGRVWRPHLISEIIENHKKFNGIKIVKHG